MLLGNALRVAAVAALLWPLEASAMVLVSDLQTPDSANAVQVAGDLAYVADGDSGLRIVDVSDPARPRELGTVVAGDFAQDVAVQGDFAYVAARYWTGLPRGGGDLQIIDVSDPFAPTRLSRVRTSSNARAVDVANGFAYVADAGGGLRVIDVSDPALAHEVGALSGPLQSANDLEVVDGVAYLSDFRIGLWIVDVSDPSAPIEVARRSVPGFTSSIDVADGLAYVGSQVGTQGRVTIFDVSDPSMPLLLGGFDTPGPVGTIRATGELALVGVIFAGLVAYDVADPTAPVQLGSFSAGTAGIEIVDQLAYVVGGDLFVVDVSKPQWPREVGAFATFDAMDVELVGSVVHLADGILGYRGIDVSDPTAPVELGSLSVPFNDVRKVVVRDGIAYLADENLGLRTIDVSDPSTPTGIATLPTPGPTLAVVLHGSIAYAANGSSGLRLIDVLDPAAPFEIGVFAGFVDRIEVEGDVAFAGAGTSGLRLIDVSDPTAPGEVGAFEPPGRVWGVAVSDSLAYVGGSQEFDVVDVSNPSQPEQIGMRAGAVENVSVASFLAYLGTGSTVRVIDVSRPSTPIDLGGTLMQPAPLFASVEDVEIADGLVYVAAGAGGLRVIDFGPEYVPAVLEVTIDIRPGSDWNAINARSRGVVPVAILGSEAFDVANVNAPTLAFGPGGVAPKHQRGGHFEDVNGDGYIDLLSHYPIEGSGIAPGQAQACVQGALLDDTRLEGCDRILVVGPCGLGFELALLLPAVAWAYGRSRPLRRLAGRRR